MRVMLVRLVTLSYTAGAAGTVNEAGAGILKIGALLTTNSVTGTTLGNANTVTSFNATNSGVGIISLTNAAPLAITAIAQNGTGDVTVNNTGAVNVTGSIAAGSNNIFLTSSGALSESGAGLVSGALLTTNSVGGLTLNGSNAVSSFNATNNGGAVSFTNTGVPLTITGIAQSGTGNVSVNNTGAVSITGSMCSWYRITSP